MKKLSVLLAILFLLAGAVLAERTMIYVSESGEKRIAVFRLDEMTGALSRLGAVELPGDPGSLAISGDRHWLYAALRGTRQIASLRLDAATGLPGEPAFAPGVNAAYLHPDRSGRWLLAASYGEGCVSVSRIVDGVVRGEPVQVLATGSKAHAILPDLANRFVLVPHVGETNKVERLRFDTQAGQLLPQTPLTAEPGQGPRHLQFHPSGRWLYLVNEQGQSVTLCDYDADSGSLTIRQTASTTPADWDKAKGSCADLHISEDGRFLYASNRGHDSLAIFAIDSATGVLQPRGTVPTEKTPRSFAISPGAGDFVISAGQGSSRLLVYRRDRGAGTLTPLQSYGCGRSPAWVLTVRVD